MDTMEVKHRECFGPQWIYTYGLEDKFEIININIKKIFETDENFFLYTDEKHSLILDKDGFEIGNSKDFAEFIKRKCPFKYRNEEEK